MFCYLQVAFLHVLLCEERSNVVSNLHSRYVLGIYENNQAMDCVFVKRWEEGARKISVATIAFLGRL